MRKFVKMTVFLGLGLSLAACADGPYEPIVDGQVTRNYHSDLDACRQVSTQKQSTGKGATTGAVVGGLIGGVEDESVGGAVVGAALGGLIGSAEEKSDVRDDQERIVSNCMRGRGHNVVG
ncbi:glycine zipper 2TM domain-containing protein [uncultured Roseovarius sp.]|uniref:glycine zipper 2TM domain-containing protein n=1 Tax=uncultured Roseovarius sp. TaxID=293344 RepID=UPI002616CFCE|nr:glycine zipper 2TM domain-containing protein [uncultured Roseovarius sp.]